MDPDGPCSVLGLAVQVWDDGSAILMKTDSEQRDLNYDADKTGVQGRSTLNSSIGGSELGAPSSSTRPHHMSTTNQGSRHRLRRTAAAAARAVWCMRRHDSVAEVGDDGVAAAVATAALDPSERADAAPPLYHASHHSTAAARKEPGMATLIAAKDLFDVAAAAAAEVGDDESAVDEGDNEEEEFPSDAQLNLARLLCAHAHDHVLTQQTLVQQTKAELGGADLSTHSRIKIPRVFDDMFHNDDNNRHFEKEDEDGHDGGLWDEECDGELNDEEEEAVLQEDSCVLMLMRREEPPWPPAPDDTNATGPTYATTYDDITKSPPPHLWCVVSPLSSLPPVLRCTATSPRVFCRRRPGVEAGSGRAWCHSVV